MNRQNLWIIILMVFGIVLAAGSAYSSNYTYSNVAVGGYDVVSYHTEGKAVRGTGWHVAVHDGTTYLFASKQNRKQFVSSPQKYLPEYGGFCAYGAAVGKKFYADPTIWKIVDGKLYLNLDAEIQKKWVDDIPGNIKKADANWPGLHNQDPAGI